MTTTLLFCGTQPSVLGSFRSNPLSPFNQPPTMSMAPSQSDREALFTSARVLSHPRWVQPVVLDPGLFCLTPSRQAASWLITGVVAGSLTFGPSVRAEEAPAASGVLSESTGQLLQSIITANRVETPLPEVSSSVSVVTQKEIAQRQNVTLADTLRGLPGVNVTEQGAGGTSAVFIRGSKAEHVLTLLDGVELNDPISPGRSYNFASLFPAASLDRVEVLRGPQGALYGSDAMGGVVQMITGRGEGPLKVSLYSEAGAYQSFLNQANLRGGTETWHYNVSAFKQSTDGFSAFDRRLGGQEQDGFRNSGVSARLDYTPSRHFSNSLFAWYLDTQTDLDNSDSDDINYVSQNKQLMLKNQIRTLLWQDKWEQLLSLSYLRHDRDTFNGFDAAHPQDRALYRYNANTVKLDWQHNLTLGPWSTLTTGLDMRKEAGNLFEWTDSSFGPYASALDTRTNTLTGAYVQHSLKLWDRWVTTAGVRYNRHSQFGDKMTWHLGSVVTLPKTQTRLKATLGTGFKAPTLYQLYSDFGTQTLEPETSLGMDAGIEQPLFHNTVNLGATVFQNRYKNLIDFDLNTFTYQNFARVNTRGVELYAQWRPAEPLTVNANYTYTHSHDDQKDASLVRRPWNAWNVNVNYAFSKKGNLNVGVVSTGNRDDYDFSVSPSVRVQLKPYTLVQASASYQVTKNVALVARIQNALNKTYEEIKGYGVPGRSIYMGLKIML